MLFSLKKTHTPAVAHNNRSEKKTFHGTGDFPVSIVWLNFIQLIKFIRHKTKTERNKKKKNEQRKRATIVN